jgi:hypothetical protein
LDLAKNLIGLKRVAPVQVDCQEIIGRKGCIFFSLYFFNIPVKNKKFLLGIKN